MTTDTDTLAVREILETALRLPLRDVENPRRTEIEGWDSLTHLEIVFMLEEVFDLRFSEDEIVALSSLDDILSVVRNKHAT
jgi:acyl carrier protein